MQQNILCVLRRRVTDPKHRSHMALWRNGSASDSSSLLWSLLKVSCSSQLRVKEALCFCTLDQFFCLMMLYLASACFSCVFVLGIGGRRWGLGWGEVVGSLCGTSRPWRGVCSCPVTRCNRRYKSTGQPPLPHTTIGH
jgi:hypothetical protein